MDLHRAVARLDDEADAGLLCLGHEEVGDLAGHVAQVAVAEVKLHSSGVAQEVGQDVAQAASFTGKRVHAAGHAGAVFLGEGGVQDLLAQELRVEGHGGQRVLDLVRQAARHGRDLGVARALGGGPFRAVDAAAQRAVDPPRRQGHAGHAREQCVDDRARQHG